MQLASSGEGLFYVKLMVSTYFILDSKTLQNILQTGLPWCVNASGICNTFLFRYSLKKNLWTDLSSILNTWLKPTTKTYAISPSVSTHGIHVTNIVALPELVTDSDLDKNKTLIWHLKGLPSSNLHLHVCYYDSSTICHNFCFRLMRWHYFINYHLTLPSVIHRVNK